LHDRSPRPERLTQQDVFNSNPDDVTASELAVDRKIEERQIARPLSKLEPNPNRPNLLDLERRLGSNDLASVPCDATETW
jgi:hypothetical protein